MTTTIKRPANSLELRALVNQYNSMAHPWCREPIDFIKSPQFGKWAMKYKGKLYTGYTFDQLVNQTFSILGVMAD